MKLLRMLEPLGFMLVLGLAFGAVLLGSEARAQEIFFGLPHTAQGQATVSIDSGNVVVSNIGASGQDGVAIGLGSSEGMHLVMDLPPSDIPMGATITYRLHKDSPEGGLFVSGMLIERIADGFRHTPSFAGSKTYTLKLLLNGAVVYRQMGRSGVAGVVASLGPRAGICSHYKDPPGYAVTSQETAVSDWDLGGGVLVTANTLVAEAEAPAFSGPGVLRADFMAGGIPSFTIPAEFLMMFGTQMANAHRALGEARFNATAGQLTMSNIGASGQDGVRVDFDELGEIFGLPPIRGIDVELVPLSLLPAESFTLSAIGVFSGVPRSPLGHASLRNNGGQMELTADFSAIGASTVRVEVYNAGQSVGSVDVPGGVLGTLRAGVRIDGCGKQSPTPLPCYILKTELPTSFTPATGGPPITGDEFRLLASNARGTIDRLSFFDISVNLTSNGSFSIVGETLTTPQEGSGDRAP